MALINCYECGKEISDAALACPNCGAPVKQTIKVDKNDIYVPIKTTETKRKGGPYELVGFLLILAGMGSCLTLSDTAVTFGLICVSVGFVIFLFGRFQ